MAVVRPPSPVTLRESAERGDPNAPAVRAVEAVIERALALHASDVHIEPSADGSGRIRFRVDGVLQRSEPLASQLYMPLVSRVKLLAGLDIANRRLPQDGRYSATAHGVTVDARVSSIPTIDGEKLAIRLLDHQTTLPQLDRLGMDAETLRAFRAAAHAPWGFVVVSGPTGSGKTTTLYAALAELDRASRNVCTVEDPIELRLADTAQVQVNARAGLTFPTVLRSFMRQDPDVIMIGEMRDAETVAVGISAALSGQAVFATTHSNDAARTIDRLIEFGVERHSLAAGLTAVLAQRLVRRLCDACRRPSAAGFVAHGCAACANTGYAGRVGIFELLDVDAAIADAIATGASSAALARLARDRGLVTLAEDARRKVNAGLTCAAEVERVVGRERAV